MPASSGSAPRRATRGRHAHAERALVLAAPSRTPAAARGSASRARSAPCATTSPSAERTATSSPASGAPSIARDRARHQPGMAAPHGAVAVGMQDDRLHDAAESTRSTATLPAPSNRLANETSLYLRQHMHNPVDWCPWGEEALAAARAAEKPLLVSIGYSACHWCHVMERESFEDPETAALMNELFVCVKVDREERPDVDQIYMDTVVRLHGPRRLAAHGVLRAGRAALLRRHLLPARAAPRPALLPPAARGDRPHLARAARAGRRHRAPDPGRAGGAAARRRERAARRRDGGRRPRARCSRARTASTAASAAARSSRRPPTSRCCSPPATCCPRTKRARALDFLRFSCGEMARRGLWDHLGGGFHRYCVDGHWGVPHFEKMLYDQGQLLRIYTDVWRRSGERDEDLAWPVRETAAWLRREMTGPEGGLYGSQDADSEGHEGRFYVWTPAEVEAVLGRERAAAFCRAYAVTADGNFEGTNVLWDLARGPRGDFAAERAELFAARAKRVPPATDTKRVLGWNALAISGLAYAGSVLDEPALLADAVAAAEFVRDAPRGARRALVARVRGGPGEGAGLPRRPRRLARGAPRPAPRDGRPGAARARARGRGADPDALLRPRRERPVPDAGRRRAASRTGRAPTTTAPRRTRPASPRSACCARPRSPAARTCGAPPSACCAATPSCSSARPRRTRRWRARRSSPSAASPAP